MLVLYFSLIVVCSVTMCYGALFSDVAKLHSSLETIYTTKTVRPVLDQNDVVNISVSLSLNGLNDFNELGGELDISLALHAKWRDELLVWDPSVYGGKASVLLDPGAVWNPPLYVMNTANDMAQIIGDGLPLRVRNDGLITWTTGTNIKVTCSVDVTFFPFDTQTCGVLFSPRTYSKEEVNLTAAFDTVSTEDYIVHEKWDLIDSAVYIDAEGYSSILQVNLTFKRRSKFVVIYIIVPIILLGITNSFVFLIPSETGERSSVAMTIFLSIFVFLTIINDMVPQSSMPIAYIYIYMLVLVIYSSVVFLLCVLTLRVYQRSGTVTDGWKRFVTMFGCLICRNRKSEKNVAGRNGSNISQAELDEELSPDCKEMPTHAHASSNSQVCWSDVGKVIDIYLFVCAFCLYTVYSIVVFFGLKHNVIFHE